MSVLMETARECRTRTAAQEVGQPRCCDAHWLLDAQIAELWQRCRDGREERVGDGESDAAAEQQMRLQYELRGPRQRVCDVDVSRGGELGLELGDRVQQRRQIGVRVVRDVYPQHLSRGRQHHSPDVGRPGNPGIVGHFIEEIDEQRVRNRA